MPDFLFCGDRNAEKTRDFFSTVCSFALGLHARLVEQVPVAYVLDLSIYKL